jgi:acetolactate synthase-1/2/3 large subunit
MRKTSAAPRIGGHLVAESLRALGAEVVFGLPGIHVLPVWEGLRATELRVLGFRQELNAGFAADGHARVTGRPTPLVVSTGPGAFMTLAPLMEAFTAFVPIVVVASQIDADAIGEGRGHLHETPDQAASFAPLVKWTERAGGTAEIPELLAEAWRRAATPPQGPVYVEVPFDVLHAAAETTIVELDGRPRPGPRPAEDDLQRVIALLAAAERPLVVAGGGAVRSSATPELLELAARLDAPVATTFTGKGVFPERHPLALGSAWGDPAHRELAADADVVLCVGSWLGWDVTDYFRLRLRGTLIQIDAAPERIGVNFPAVGLVGDAKETLQALLNSLAPAGRPQGGAARVAGVRERVERGLIAQPNRLALDVLETIEAVLPDGAAAAWDSTILAYTACSYLRVSEPRRFLYPAGSSTLGYAFPAALGAAAALPDAPVLTVVGDGGFQYGIAELATAKQHGLDVALLLIDDGGYGILREYQDGSGFDHAGVDLEHPDFVALSEAYAVPARRSSPEHLAADLEWALGHRGPAIVLLEEVLRMPEPTCSQATPDRFS